MRRISLALALVVSVYVATATTQAAGSHPSRHSAITTLLWKQHGLSHLSVVRSAIRGATERHAIAHSRSQQTAQTLALPASAFSPAVLNSQYNYSESTTDTSQVSPDKNWFAASHTPNNSGIYESFGFQYGWYQRADWTGTNPTTYFRYQGAKMSSVQGAKNAWSDGIAYTSSQFGATAQQCSNDPTRLGCEYLDYSYTNNGTSYSERYVALQLGACLGEITGTMPASSVSAYGSTLTQVVNNMTQAAVTAMNNVCGTVTPTPPPATSVVPTAIPTVTRPAGTTQFSVVSVRFEKAGSKPDWNLQNNPLTQIKAGTKVRLSLYYRVESLAESSTKGTYEFQLKLNGKKVFDKTYTATLTTADTYRFSVNNVKLAKAGNYTLAAGANIDGKVDAASSQLRAVQNYVAPKPVSFSLTNVSLSKSTFRANQQVTIHIAFVVRNLKGTATGYLTRTLLANINGQWKGVSTSTSSTLVQNGQNNQVMTTTINTPGHYEWLIAVTVGASTQRKIVPVTAL